MCTVGPTRSNAIQKLGLVSPFGPMTRHQDSLTCGIASFSEKRELLALQQFVFRVFVQSYASQSDYLSTVICQLDRRSCIVELAQGLSVACRKPEAGLPVWLKEKLPPNRKRRTS